MEIISRKEAIEKGLKRYFTGKPCKYGHVSERYVGGVCVECNKNNKGYLKNWRSNNKEYRKDYYKNNKTLERERMKEYRKNNKESLKEYNKEWHDENKEYRKEYVRNRYATDIGFKTSCLCRDMLRRTLKATNSTKDTQTYELLGYCNEQLKECIESKLFKGMSWDNFGDWHIDHIYPVTRYIKEGVECPAIINHLDNLIPMWAEHNMEKSERTLEEYLDDRKDLVELYGRFL